MIRTRGMISWILLPAFLLFHATQSAQGQGNKGTVVKLSENMFRIASASFIFVNLLVFTGRDGILLVDTGEEYPNEQLESIVKKHKPAGIQYIINTHLHDDHTGGNDALGKKAAVMNFANLAQWARKGVLSPGKDELKGKTGKTFAGYYRLAFNGKDIFIIPVAGAHSEADVIVYFKGSGIVHLGDLLFSDSFPLLFGDLNRYQEILEKALDVFPANVKFVAGHGKDYSMAQLKNYYQVIVDTRRIVENEFKAGKSIQAVMGANALKKWESYGNAFPLVTTIDWIAAIHQAYLQKKQ
jgi:cyclase